MKQRAASSLRTSLSHNTMYTQDDAALRSATTAGLYYELNCLFEDNFMPIRVLGNDLGGSEALAGFAFDTLTSPWVEELKWGP